MDVERTMEFILENLASVTAKQERAEKQIEAIRKLVVSGMKMVVDIGKQQKQLTEHHKRSEKEIAELRAAQKETDRQLRTWIASNRGSNGHGNGSNGHKKKPN
jgi:hypothetical protein